jgi:hypothetical protein
MAPKQRQVRIEQKSALAAMQRMESRSDEELQNETKFKAAAQAILGARAAERYDAKAARGHFQRAIAAARPQERMQLRRMAEASLALAERRPADLKTSMEKLGQAPPSSRQLFLLRLTGLIVPPQGASIFRRAGGILLLILIIVALLFIGFGVVELVALPFGGISTVTAAWVGALVVIAVLAGLAVFGRRRQKRAKAQRASAAAG